MKNAISLMIQNAREYLELKIDLFKVEFTERNAKLASRLIATVIISSIGVFSLMLLSIAAAFYLGTIWGAWYWGFLATGLFYLLLFIIVIVKKNAWIKYPVEDMIIDNYFEKEEEKEQEKENQDEKHESVDGKKTAA
ncbi:MAG: phage holin family protein [Bacteroidetes bacterium]|nr:phage holin family protein [Bacteroidota bacterium]MBP7400551.1 phage holin family protein [Chitinophagales bacterium]MBK7108591.1 phage holin family protein [Bacteroidota bacterium]MBK8489083.1 phage holin family protein [Bacteroidota bacterium]MBK8680932.1 phage holin family protein [Bacteroidota bacterium]